MMAWWQDLAARERRLLVAAGVLVALVTVWLAVWEPLTQTRRALYEELAADRALLDWLERIEPEARRLDARDRAERSLGGRAPLAVVDQSARAAGLAGALRRIEPGSGEAIRVEFEAAAFAELMGWLQDLLRQRPFRVQRFEAARAQDPGRVDASVELRPQTASR